MALYGMDDVREIVTEFLTKHTAQPPKNGAAMHKLLVFQEFGGQSSEPFQSYPIDPSEDREALVEDVVSAIERAAQEIGSGTIPFVLKMDGANARRRFTVEHGLEEGEEEEFPKGFVPRPTERGVLGQLMRHLEAQARLNSEMQLGQARINSTFMREMAERNRALEREAIRHATLFQELMTAQSERETATMVAQRQEQRRDFLAEQLVPIAQTAATKLLGGSSKIVPAPGRETPLEQMVMSLVSSLSPEEMQGILGALRTGNKVLMMEMIQGFQAAKEQAAAAAQEQQNGQNGSTPPTNGNGN